MNRRLRFGIKEVDAGRQPIGATLDPSIVERARRGDLQAFESIVADRIGAVYRLTLAIVGNEADAADATQETFIAAWRKVRTLRDPARLEAWLARIAMNAARMTVRGRGRRALREIHEASSGGIDAFGSSPDASFDRADRADDDARRLTAALDRLDPDRRAILAMRHLEGKGIAEIAAALGIREGTAKSRLFAARRALQAALDGEARR
jgi:RNA polymerase sigma-70 factor (ECF subfamily)